MRRYAVPPIDVDGEPLCPDNQHPIDEADDVVDLTLLLEGDMTAFARHKLELFAAVADMTVRLARYRNDGIFDSVHGKKTPVLPLNRLTTMPRGGAWGHQIGNAVRNPIFPATTSDNCASDGPAQRRP